MLSIGVVARQTGLEISTLRKWEARYGFPCPMRRESGQRSYSSDDVTALQAIARRLAKGERVSRVIGEHVANLPNAVSAEPLPTHLQLFKSALDAICSKDVFSLRLLLNQARQGVPMQAFVDNFAAPLTIAVGEAWSDGYLPICSEHLYSSLMESLLIREAESNMPQQAPQILLTTLAGEKHTLGLAMVHAVLAEAGIPSLRLYSDLPVGEIVDLCRTHAFRAVGISTSLYCPPRMLDRQLSELRTALPESVVLWLGGGGMDRIRCLPPGSEAFGTFSDLIEAARSVLDTSRAPPVLLDKDK